MQIDSQNHRNENNGLFGLLPMYLVYQVLGPEKAKFKSEKERVHKEKLAYDKEAKKARETLMSFRKNVSKKIAAYNNAIDENYTASKPYTERLIADDDNYNNVVKQIDELLTKKFFHRHDSLMLKKSGRFAEQKQALLDIRALLTSELILEREIFVNKGFLDANWNRYLEHRPNSQIPYTQAPRAGKSKAMHIDSLNTIKLLMERALTAEKGNPNYDELVKAYSQVRLQIKLLTSTASVKTIKEAEAEYKETMNKLSRDAGKIMDSRMDEALAHAAEKTKIQKKPAYIELSDMYDRATVTPIISAGSEQFKNFWTNPEYGLSSSDRDESKNLFFSILRRDTKSFEDSFVLGPDFGEDAEENRKRFPSIYEAWVEHKNFDKDKMDSTDKKVTAIEEKIRAKTVPKISTLIDKANATPYQIGLDISTLNAISRTPEKEYFDKKHNKIGHYIHQLNRKIQSDDDFNDDKALKSIVSNLEIRQELAEAEYEREKNVFRKKTAGDSFTRSSLKGNPQLVMELAMRKFHKAMTMVDKTLPHGDWKSSYNPAVRRMLITNIYDEGVSDFRIDFGTGKEVLIDDLGVDNRWMLMVLGKSPHYDMQEKSDRMDEKRRRMLPVLQLANEVHVDLKNYKRVNLALDAVIKWHSASPAKKAKMDKGVLAGFPKGMIALFKEQSEQALSAKLTQFEKQEKNSKKFLETVKIAMKDPYSKDAEALILAIRNGDYVDIITPEMLAEYEENMSQIELGYNMLSLDDKSRMDFMERLGISTVGVYEGYMAALNTKPEIDRYTYSVDNWDRLMASPDPADFEKLMFMLENSMGSSDKQGKKHFLNVFRAMHGEGSENMANMEDSKVHTMDIYMMIKGEIKDREAGSAMSADGEAEYFAKLDGETIGDKATRYIKGAVNMLVGPGQSWANRGAGLILMIAALKAAHSAYKGDTKAGKALRLLFVAGAAELATKEVTGRGILERFGFETLMEAGEGTSEAVLVMDGVDHMHDKMVGPEEHTRALYELRKIPFHEAMAWYMDTNTNKEDGMPTSGEDDKFPPGIDVDNIVFGEKWKTYEPERAGRKVVMQTMKHFFEYSGRKDHESPRMSALSLNERWATSMEDGFDANNLKYSKFAIPPAALALYKANRDKLTWGVVIDAEIDQKARNETVGKHGATPVLDYFAEKGAEFIEWSRQTLLSPTTLAATQLYENLGDKAEKVADFVDELAEKGETKVHFGIEGMKLKWEEHEIEIRNFFGSNVELIWEGVEFFPSALIGANQWAVPALLAKIKQGKEILFEDQIPQISGEALRAQDIVEGDKVLLLDPDFKDRVRILQQRNTTINENDAINQVKLDVGPAGVIEARNRALESPFAYEVDKNPLFKHLGIYQRPFMEAMNAIGEVGDPEYPKPMYYENNTAFDKKVGYFITETTVEGAGASGAGYNAKERNSKMVSKARKQAVEHYRLQHTSLTLEDVDNMMFPIHAAVKLGKSGVEKRYTFWRMPLPGGKEFNLRASGHWADTKVPDKYRHPFYVDPSRGAWGNFKEAYGADSPTARKAIATALSLGGRVGGVSMSTAERLGRMGDWVANKIFPPERGEDPSRFLQEMVEWSPENRQIYDEITGLAGTETSARSDFYRDPAHPERQAMYKALRSYAILTGESYYYGIIPDRPRTDWDNPEPATFRPPTAWEAFYEAWLIDHNYNPDGTRRGQVAGARARRGKRGRKGRKSKKGKGKKKT